MTKRYYIPELLKVVFQFTGEQKLKLELKICIYIYMWNPIFISAIEIVYRYGRKRAWWSTHLRRSFSSITPRLRTLRFTASREQWHMSKFEWLTITYQWDRELQMIWNGQKEWSETAHRRACPMQSRQIDFEQTREGKTRYLMLIKAMQHTSLRNCPKNHRLILSWKGEEDI